MEYKINYKVINEEWNGLKLLDNSKPNLDKKWTFIYNLTLRYAKAMLERSGRYIEDVDGKVQDQVIGAICRMKDGWVMESAKYCTMLAMAAINNRTAQEKFEENIYKQLNDEQGFDYKQDWDYYTTADNE